MLMDFDTVEAGASTVSAVIAGGHRPGGDGDDGPAVPAGRRGLHPRRVAGRGRGGAARRGRRACRNGVAADTDADHGDRRATTACAPCGSPPTTPSGRCCGRGASRRSARSPGSSRTTTCTTPWCRGPGCRRCWRRVRDHAPATTCSCSTCSTPVTATSTRCSSTTGGSRACMERVHAAGEEIVRVSVEAGGVLSGEHGIGLEKRDLMPLMFSAVDLAAQAALRDAFDPDGLANPGKVLPSPAGCGDLARRAEARGRAAGRCGSDASFADEVGTTDPVTITGLGTRGGPVAGVRTVAAPAGIDWIQPAEMTVSVRRRHARRRARRRPCARTASASRSRRAGPSAARLAVGRSGLRRLGDGPVRDAVLQVRYVSAAGEVVKARRADGQERQRVRPAAACSSARAARSGSSATSSCGRGRGRASSSGSAAPSTRTRCWPGCTARRRCCGTARRRGCCWRATSATSTPQVAPLGARRGRRAAGAAGRRPVVDRRPATPYGSRGRFVAEVGVGVVHHERAAAAA